MLQKPQVNNCRKKLFKTLVAKLATAEDHGQGTGVVTDIPFSDVDSAVSRTVIDHNENSLKNTATDFNCNTAEARST